MKGNIDDYCRTDETSFNYVYEDISRTFKIPYLKKKFFSLSTPFKKTLTAYVSIK